ncbi:hypothetical protein BE20_40635 [Sorangium cellulosum]|nr:hypothetical protein BE20_40635 [Sorangium cellulosum]
MNHEAVATSSSAPRGAAGTAARASRAVSAIAAAPAAIDVSGPRVGSDTRVTAPSSASRSTWARLELCSTRSPL